MNNEKIDLAEYKKVGMIQQKQKDYFAIRLHATGGDFTSEQLCAIADVSKKYGNGQVHFTTRQGVEIHFIHHSNLTEAREELESSGIAMGACGPRIRIITACPGNSTCKWGIINTKEIAHYLDEKYFRSDTPHKFKMAVTGCPNNCAKASENDIGIMGGIISKWNKEKCKDCKLCINICPAKAINKVDDTYSHDKQKCINCGICFRNCPAGAWEIDVSGYIIWIGGTMGKKPRIATKLTGIIESLSELYRLVDKIIEFYRTYGRKKERFGHMIDRIGEEIVKAELLSGGENIK